MIQISKLKLWWIAKEMKMLIYIKNSKNHYLLVKFAQVWKMKIQKITQIPKYRGTKGQTAGRKPTTKYDVVKKTRKSLEKLSNYLVKKIVFHLDSISLSSEADFKNQGTIFGGNHHLPSRFHLLVGEKMKKDDAGGMGNWEFGLSDSGILAASSSVNIQDCALLVTSNPSMVARYNKSSNIKTNRLNISFLIYICGVYDISCNHVLCQKLTCLYVKK